MLWQHRIRLSTTDGGLPAVDAIAKGEVKVGYSGTANVNLMVTNSGAPLQYVIPEDGLITFDYYLGVASSSKNVEAAQVFSNYNLSKRGQSVFSKVGDCSIRTDVEPPTSLGVQLPALDSGKVWRPGIEDADLVQAAREEWAAAFGY
jgi:iron(III) transport system substrate-binding protein